MGRAMACRHRQRATSTAVAAGIERTVSCAKPVLGTAYGSKAGDPVVASALPFAPGDDGVGVDAQERIGRPLAGEQYRQGGLKARAQRGDFLQPLLQIGIGRLDGACKTSVRLGVLVAAAYQGVPRQLGEAIQRGEHLRRRALEQAAAAEAEQGIAAQQNTGADVGHMTERVTGNRNHLELHGGLGQLDPVAIAHSRSRFADALVVRRMNRYVVVRTQGRHAANVIVVVMSQQDRAQLQPMRDQRLLDDRSIARVDHDSVAMVIVQQPDVVVGQCR